MVDQPHLDLALGGLAVGLAGERLAGVDGRDGAPRRLHRVLHLAVAEIHQGDDQQGEDDADRAESALGAETAHGGTSFGLAMASFSRTVAVRWASSRATIASTLAATRA